MADYDDDEYDDEEDLDLSTLPMTNSSNKCTMISIMD